LAPLDSSFRPLFKPGYFLKKGLVFQAFAQLLFQNSQRRLFRVRHALHVQIERLLKLMLAGGDGVRD
jgi:hypothetical protein